MPDKYHVHSLAAHRKKIKENAARPNQKTLASRPAPTIKKESNSKDIFGSKDDSDDATSSAGDSSEDDSTQFLAKIQQKKNGTAANNKRLGKDDEIADSDVERQASSKKVKRAAGGAPVNPQPESSDDTSSTDGESESDDEAESKPKTNGAKTNKDDSSSEASDDESESSSEDEEGPIEKAAKKPEEPKAVESDAETDSSSADSDDDESEEPADTAKPEAAPMPNGTSAKPTTTKSTGGEESSNTESSSSEDEEEDDEQADVSMHIADRKSGKRATAPAVMAPDFMIRKSDQGLDGKDVAKVCSQANLEGKQLWYFTVPSNVPVSVVQNLEIQMDSAQRGDSVFSHDGEDYGISFNSGITKSTIQILVPSAIGPEYQSAKHQIDQVMQVKRLPQIAASSSQTDVEPAPPVAARPQPEGLRARYKPIGVYDPAPKAPQAQEDVEMTEAPVQPTPSKEDKKAAKAAAKAEKKAKKDKSKKGGDIVEVPSSLQDSQESANHATLKRKITSSDEDAELAAEQLKGESSAAASKGKKQKTNRTGSPELGSEPAPSKKETPVVPPVPGQDAETTTPAKKPKKEKKDKKATATPASNPTSAPDSSTVKKQTPVPIPKFPGSSQIGTDTIPSSQPTPSTKKEKLKKAKKGPTAAVTTDERKESPVPLPQQGPSN